MLTWPAKDPIEVLDYQLDWNDRLEEGETILSSTWTVVDGTVHIDSDDTLSGVATVWLSGGVDTEACELLNGITTSAGRIYEEGVKLRIRSKAR